MKPGVNSKKESSLQAHINPARKIDPIAPGPLELSVDVDVDTALE